MSDLVGNTRVEPSFDNGKGNAMDGNVSRYTYSDIDQCNIPALDLPAVH
jgi:hypothetical protein